MEELEGWIDGVEFEVAVASGEAVTVLKLVHWQCEWWYGYLDCQLPVLVAAVEDHLDLGLRDRVAQSVKV